MKLFTVFVIRGSMIAAAFSFPPVAVEHPGSPHFLTAMNTLSDNKHIVARFNREVIEQGNMQTFNELVAADFINHTAPPGTPNGRDGFAAFFTNVLRPALPDLTVELHDQIAEGDKVVTRKTISGTHKGMFLGVPATGRRIRINVTDIVRISNGQYAEHWGNADLHGALAQMK
jgi:steroid delta-isomerase-like uncharacterized protein